MWLFELVDARDLQMALPTLIAPYVEASGMQI
jgi:hypothetical protein